MFRNDNVIDFLYEKLHEEENIKRYNKAKCYESIIENATSEDLQQYPKIIQNSIDLDLTSETIYYRIYKEMQRKCKEDNLEDISLGWQAARQVDKYMQDQNLKLKDLTKAIDKAISHLTKNPFALPESTNKELYVKEKIISRIFDKVEEDRQYFLGK